MYMYINKYPGFDILLKILRVIQKFRIKIVMNLTIQ